jgi:hypothetical protein
MAYYKKKYDAPNKEKQDIQNAPEPGRRGAPHQRGQGGKKPEHAGQGRHRERTRQPRQNPASGPAKPAKSAEPAETPAREKTPSGGILSRLLGVFKRKS